MFCCCCCCDDNKFKKKGRAFALQKAFHWGLCNQIQRENVPWFPRRKRYRGQWTRAVIGAITRSSRPLTATVNTFPTLPGGPLVEAMGDDSFLSVFCVATNKQRVKTSWWRSRKLTPFRTYFYSIDKKIYLNIEHGICKAQAQSNHFSASNKQLGQTRLWYPSELTSFLTYFLKRIIIMTFNWTISKLKF